MPTLGELHPASYEARSSTRRKVNDLADHNQFPMRLFGSHIDAKQGSWALLKSQPKPKPQAAAQPAQKGKRKGKR